MGASPLPEGNNAAEMIRRLRAIDAEIFGTLYAAAGIIGGDVTIDGGITISGDIRSADWPTSGYFLDSSAGSASFSGDVTVGGTIDLTGSMELGGVAGIFSTAAAAPRWVWDVDGYGAQDLTFESGQPHQYVNGTLDASLVFVDGVTETSGVHITSGFLGDVTNRAGAYCQTDADYYGKVASINAGALSFGDFATSATLAAGSIGSGDASVNLIASSGTGTAKIFLTALDGIALTSGTAFVEPIWILPTFLNSWVDFGSGFTGMRYRKDTVGNVHVQGMAKNGTSAAAAMFVLPVGYRPTGRMPFASWSDNGAARLDIHSDGTVQMAVNGSTTWNSMNVTFAI